MFWRFGINIYHHVWCDGMIIPLQLISWSSVCEGGAGGCKQSSTTEQRRSVTLHRLHAHYVTAALETSNQTLNNLKGFRRDLTIQQALHVRQIDTFYK